MSFQHYNNNYNNPYRNINEIPNDIRNNNVYSEHNYFNSNNYGPIQDYYYNYTNNINDIKQQKQYGLAKNSKAKDKILKYRENIYRENQKYNHINTNNNPIANIAQTNINNYKPNLYKEKKENERIEETNKFNPNSDLNEQLLKVLIYIYAYEKELSQKNVFNNNEKYYLINQEWFKKFKEFYSYDIFKGNLEKLNQINNNTDINCKINDIIYHYLLNFKIEYKPSNNLGNIFTSYKSFNNIKITYPGFIIPSKIINIIKDWNEHKNKNLSPKNFIFKNNSLYYIKEDEKAIIIGKLLKNAIFTPKYILSYDSLEIQKKEFEKIIKVNINKYIEQYRYDPNKDIQELKDEYGQKIGYFIIYSNYNPSKKDGNNQRSKTNQKALKDKQFNEQKNLADENKILKKENILINNDNNNILNKQITNLKEEVQKKSDQIQDNEQLLKPNNMNKLSANIIKKQKNQIQNLKTEVNKLKKQNNDICLQLKEKDKKIQNTNIFQNDLTISNEENKKLKEQNDYFKKQILQMEIEREKLKEKFDGIEKQLFNQKELINKNNKLNKTINDLKQELNQRNEQIITNNLIKDELNKLRNENNSLIKSNKDKELELKKLKSEFEMQINNNDAIKLKEKEIEKMKKEFEIKEINSNNLMEKYKILEKQYETSNNDNNELKKKIEYLENEIKSYKEKLSNQNDIINQNDNFNKQINSLKEQLNKKDNEITNIQLNNKNEINRLKSENSSLEIEKKEVEKKLSLLNNEFNQKQNKEAHIKSLQSKEREIEKNIKDLAEKEKNSKGLNEKITNMIKKNEELENNHSVLESKNKKLIEEIKRNEAQLTNQKDLINLNKQLNDSNQELKQKNKQLENIKSVNNIEIEKLKNEKETLIKKKIDKDKELNKVKSEFEKIKKNKIELMTLINKEQEINKKMKELDEKEKKSLMLKEKNKNLEKENLELEINKTNLKKQNDKLLKDIKQLEAQIVSKKDILEKMNENQMKITQMQNNMNNININNQNQQNSIQQQNYGNYNQNNLNQFNQMNNNNNINLNPNSQPLMNNFMQNQNMNNQINISPPINTITPQTINPPGIPEKPKPKKPPEPISLYNKPPLIGLNNIGSTCYKNSVLQCLSQTTDLTNYFLKENNKDKIINNNYSKKFPRNLQLCPMYYDLIQKLWEKGAYSKSFSPNEFMDSIAKMTKNDQVQFSLNEAGDAKDFIIYLLERMHNELKKPIKNKEMLATTKPEEPLNQYDNNNAFLHFMDEFQNDTSKISDLFYGFNETTNVCQFCKNSYNSKGQKEPICYNYGIFNILIFPLDEVRKYRDQFYKLNNMNVNMGNMVNLTECFFYNQKSDYFTGDNKNYCNICKQLYDSVYTSRIFVSPNIIIIILNRGKGNIFDIKIDFTTQLDITDFVMVKEKRQIYNLYGVITHLGKSGPSAHFIASCKSPVDGKWYRYNDAFVDPITDFQKEVYNYGVPYILFYEKQK